MDESQKGGGVRRESTGERRLDESQMRGGGELDKSYRALLFASRASRLGQRAPRQGPAGVGGGGGAHPPQAAEKTKQGQQAMVACSPKRTRLQRTSFTVYCRMGKVDFTPGQGQIVAPMVAPPSLPGSTAQLPEALNSTILVIAELRDSQSLISPSPWPKNACPVVK